MKNKRREQLLKSLSNVKSRVRGTADEWKNIALELKFKSERQERTIEKVRCTIAAMRVGQIMLDNVGKEFAAWHAERCHEDHITPGEHSTETSTKKAQKR